MGRWGEGNGGVEELGVGDVGDGLGGGDDGRMKMVRDVIDGFLGSRGVARARVDA